MDESYSSIIIIVLVALLLMSHNKSNVDCRSHDSFMFCCHHNDSNTDIYLRRLNDKLDKVLEQIDKTPAEVKEKTAIEEAKCKAEFIIGCILSQLKLLRSGKLTTGRLAYIVPSFLLDYSNEEFDHYEDVIVAWHVERFNYTKEEADLLRGTLPHRNMCPEAIKLIGLGRIKGSLDDVIRHQIMQKIIKENNYVTPPDLESKVFDRWWTQLHQPLNEDQAKKEAIMKEVANGKVADFSQLDRLINEIYEEKNKQAEP